MEKYRLNLRLMGKNEKTQTLSSPKEIYDKIACAIGHYMASEIRTWAECSCVGDKIDECDLYLERIK